MAEKQLSLEEERTRGEIRRSDKDGETAAKSIRTALRTHSLLPIVLLVFGVIGLLTEQSWAAIASTIGVIAMGIPKIIDSLRSRK